MAIALCKLLLNKSTVPAEHLYFHILIIVHVYGSILRERCIKCLGNGLHFCQVYIVN